MVQKIRFAAVFFMPVFFILISFILISCKRAGTEDSYIKIQVNEQVTEKGNAIQIPQFISDNEEIQKNLRDLEKQTDDLKKIVEREQKNGSVIEMRSYLCGTEEYPQVTVIWCTGEGDFRMYNLTTLGADTRAGESITCKKALERTEMSGVDLSLRVGKLAQKSDLGVRIQSTEMNGFEIGEKGEVKEIYMKLTFVIEEEGEEKVEEHFFSYIPESEQLIKLSERGFDIP